MQPPFDPTTREAARIALQRSPVRADSPLERAIADALCLSANALRVERAGYWRVEGDFTSLRCDTVYERSTNTSAPGPTIDLRRCPEYVAALRTRRALVTADAFAAPQTRELAGYLRRHGVVGRIDTPIFVEGSIVAVVVHEHVDARRELTKADADFAATVADMIGLYLEQEKARRYLEELERTRAELESARVMEALGRMARGVAHDFNNVLGAISVQMDALAKRDRGNQALALPATLADVRAMLDQGARLAKELVTFARGDSAPPSHTDLVDVLRGMEPFLRALSNEGIHARLLVPDVPCYVSTSRTHLEQVISNLVVNARDAMIGGGTLSLVVESGADGATVLRVSDTGVGMDEHTRARIFEPFFSTKHERENGGLGLATVYGILVSAGATIDVRSALGEGTDLTIRWPVSR